MIRHPLKIRFSRPPKAGGKTYVQSLAVVSIYGNLKNLIFRDSLKLSVKVIDIYAIKMYITQYNYGAQAARNPKRRHAAN
jgi:hypothetical protein